MAARIMQAIKLLLFFPFIRSYYISEKWIRTNIRIIMASMLYIYKSRVYERICSFYLRFSSRTFEWFSCRQDVNLKIRKWWSWITPTFNHFSSKLYILPLSCQFYQFTLVCRYLFLFMLSILNFPVYCF